MLFRSLRIAELAMKQDCATILAFNKWDISETDLEYTRERVLSRARLRPELVTLSALTGRGIRRLVAKALDLADRARTRIPTSELNRFLADVQQVRQPPAVRGRRLRLLYMTQFETRPPRFAIQVNDRRLIARDYAYFLENRLRERYELEGVPLVIDFKGRRDR